MESRFVKYLLGLSFLLCFHLLAGINLFHEIATTTVVTLLIINSALLSIPWALYALIKERFGLFIALISLTIFWLAIEQMNSHLNVANPWFNLGNALSGCPQFIQWYEYTGVSGGSLWILLANCTLFYAVYHFSKSNSAKSLVWAAVFISVPLVLIHVSNRMAFSFTGQKSEALILETTPNKNSVLKVTFNELLDASKEHKSDKTKYIVWPESAFGGMMQSYDLEKNILTSMIRRNLINDSLTFIAGILLKTGEKNFNAAVVIRSEDVFAYKKERLVPFVEYSPALLGWFKPIKWSSIEMSSGDGSSTIPRGLSIGICYEALFGEIISSNCMKSNGGIIVIISNEEWTPGASKNLLQICSIRAIENRKYILRSTNTGITSLISPDGIIERRLESKKLIETLIVDVVPNDYITFYMRHGDYIGRIAIVLSSILVICFGIEIASVSSKL